MRSVRAPVYMPARGRSPETPDGKGRAGFKIVSGDVNLAYFSYSETDPVIAAPRAWLNTVGNERQ